MIKSCSGIVAVLAVLFCCSQAEAAPPEGAAGSPEAQGAEWVLYEDLPDDGEIVSFNQAGDGDGAFEICQSEDGAVGSIAETTQGGLVCRTVSGAKDSFYVLQLAEGADDGEAGGLAAKMQKKLGTEQAEVGELPPLLTFEFTDEERKEIGEVLAETDAIKRMTEECASADRPETCGPKPKQGAMASTLLFTLLRWWF